MGMLTMTMSKYDFLPQYENNKKDMNADELAVYIEKKELILELFEASAVIYPICDYFCVNFTDKSFKTGYKVREGSNHPETLGEYLSDAEEAYKCPLKFLKRKGLISDRKSYYDDYPMSELHLDISWLHGEALEVGKYVVAEDDIRFFYWISELATKEFGPL